MIMFCSTSKLMTISKYCFHQHLLNKRSKHGTRLQESSIFNQSFLRYFVTFIIGNVVDIVAIIIIIVIMIITIITIIIIVIIIIIIIFVIWLLNLTWQIIWNMKP